jgi:predicted ester cyclase
MPESEAWEWFLPAHRAFRKAFPDFHGIIEGIMGEDERVAVWAKITGTFTKPYDQGGMAGIEPKGQKLEWSEFYVYDFSKGGPHVIYWGIDELGRLRQLGAIE